MKSERVNLLWTIGVAVALAAFQMGCQQAQESAAESSSQTANEPSGAGASASAATSSGSSAMSQSSRPTTSGGSAAAAAPQPRTVTLAAGTPLKVRPVNNVSTDVHNTGQTFMATLEEPLVEGNWVIAEKGATVEGIVVEADKGGRVSGVARLTVALARLQTEDGQTIEISTSPVTVQAQTTKREDATKIAIGTGVGAAIGAIAGGGKGAGIGAATGAGAGTGVVLATRGDAAEIASETVLNFELRAPVTITQKM